MEFLVRPFGLCNATVAFWRLMNKAFAEEINLFLLVYLDNIFIFSRTIEGYWRHPRWALQRLCRTKVHGRLHKCDFLKTWFDYHGFGVRAAVTQASSEKVKAKVEWPQSKSQYDVRSLLKLDFYHRKLIRGFSQFAKALRGRKKSALKWQWGEAKERIHLALRVALTIALVLGLLELNKQFVVTTDASDAAVGEILE